MQFTQEALTTVRVTLKGARLDKFNESVRIIESSMTQNGWIPGGSRSASKGFYQGSGINYDPTYYSGPEHDEDFALGMCLTYGSNLRREIGNAIERMAHANNQRTGKPVINTKKHSLEFIEAWITICNEAYEMRSYLDELRPAPVVTPIGLSPKVTATLTEMNLNLELPSIKVAEIAYREVPVMAKDGAPLWRYGKQVFEMVPYVKWTEGTKLGRSRFSGNCSCLEKGI